MRNKFPSLAWKSPGKSLNVLEIHIILELGIVLEGINNLKRLRHSSGSQITVLENLNFDLEKYWKNTYEEAWEPCSCRARLPGRAVYFTSHSDRSVTLFKSAAIDLKLWWLQVYD